MSGKRIVKVVDPCEHEEPYDFCVRPVRTLTEGQYVLIEKEDGEWPRDQVFAMFNQGCLCDTDEARSILDALSDHTEGET